MNIELLLKVIRETCTAAHLKDFLQGHGLRHTAANWDDLLEKCVKPALKAGSLKDNDLLALLQDVEEHGRQHVFLYSIDLAKAKEIIDPTRVTLQLKKAGLSDVIAHPKILDKPASPTLAAVRWEPSDNANASLIIKFVQKHEYHDFLGEKVEGTQFVVRYQIVAERLVDVLKVNPDGTVEVRLARRGGSVKYPEQIKKFWEHVKVIADHAAMKEVSLGRAKDHLIRNSNELSELVRYSTSTLANDYGYSARFAAGGKKDDLVSDDGCKLSVQAFLSKDGHCEEANIWFKPQQSGFPTREVHVYVSGELNEYLLPGQCTTAEYQYVLDQLRRLNKPLS